MYFEKKKQIVKCTKIFQLVSTDIINSTFYRSV